MSAFDLDERIKDDQLEYLKFASANMDRDIYIYGAGRMAKPLMEFLVGQGIMIKGFCVQSVTDNKQTELGKPIVAVKSLKGQKVAIALGVNPRLNDEVERILKELGLNVYFKATEYLRYFGKYNYDFYSNPMIEITTKMGCSVNCKYCPQSVLLKKYYEIGNRKDYLSINDFKKCIDKLPGNTLVEFAGFTEPFLNPECLDMLRYAFIKGFRVNLFTTLVGVTTDVLKEIIKMNFEEFVLHVPDVEGYSNICVDSNYLRMIDILVEAKKKNGEPFIDYACSQGTISSLVKEHLGGNTRIFISLLDRAGNIDDEALFGARNIHGPIRCEVSKTINHNVLLPDGSVVLCAQDYGLKHVLGNLLTQKYEQIMESKEARHIRANMKSECAKVLCRNCSLAKTVN